MKGRYDITILPSAEKQIQKLSKPVRIKIVDRITALAINPRPTGVKKLTGRAAYRIGIGNYRVIYEIEDHNLVINVVAVGDRKDIYK